MVELEELSKPLYRGNVNNYRSTGICKTSEFPKVKNQYLKYKIAVKGTVSSHNDQVLWVTSEKPILIGRWKDYLNQRAEGGTYEKAEKFVIKHFEGVKKAPGSILRHVDASRVVCGNSRYKQGLEIKYMCGFHETPPQHVRGSIKQWENLASYAWVQPSGYVVVSRDYHRYPNRPSIWIWTVWFLPVVNHDKWKYFLLKELGIGPMNQGYRTARSRTFDFRRDVNTPGLRNDETPGNRWFPEGQGAPMRPRRVSVRQPLQNPTTQRNLFGHS
jgi:hypothetical protein